MQPVKVRNLRILGSRNRLAFCDGLYFDAVSIDLVQQDVPSKCLALAFCVVEMKRRESFRAEIGKSWIVQTASGIETMDLNNAKSVGYSPQRYTLDSNVIYIICYRLSIG